MQPLVVIRFAGGSMSTSAWAAGTTTPAMTVAAMRAVRADRIFKEAPSDEVTTSLASADRTETSSAPVGRRSVGGSVGGDPGAPALQEARPGDTMAAAVTHVQPRGPRTHADTLHRRCE